MKVFEFNSQCILILLGTIAGKYEDLTDLFYHCTKIDELRIERILSSPYVLHSVYVHQIRKWLRYFPRNQFLFIKSEGI